MPDVTQSALTERVIRMTARQAFLWGAFTVLLVPTTALAQRAGQQGTTTNGLFGQNTVGGSSGFYNSASQSFGASGSGSNSGSGAGNGTNAQNPFAQQNVAATAQQNAPQIQLQQQPGQFIGADSADTGNFRSLQGNAAGRSNGMSGLQNLFQQFSQADINSQQRQATQPQIRVQLNLGFRPTPVAVTSAQTVERRLMTLPGIAWRSPGSVTLEGRTAILRGTVASEDDRRLAEALAKMEPDVLAVRNELVVDSTGATAEQ
jgi:hypothetical protein